VVQEWPNPILGQEVVELILSRPRDPYLSIMKALLLELGRAYTEVLPVRAQGLVGRAMRMFGPDSASAAANLILADELYSYLDSREARELPRFGAGNLLSAYELLLREMAGDPTFNGSSAHMFWGAVQERHKAEPVRPDDPLAERIEGQSKDISDFEQDFYAVTLMIIASH